jgi:CheY-like chemotaxis protein
MSPIAPTANRARRPHHEYRKHEHKKKDQRPDHRTAHKGREGRAVTAPAPTVLVIDDEKATLTMFRLFLNAYGFSVLLAEDGKTGLDLVRRRRPEIVFTDLKMPEMDGLQVLKQIKRIAAATQVIVITGHGDMDLVMQALNLDATDFINKPIQRSALNAALQRATERLRQPAAQRGGIGFSIENSVGRIDVRETLRMQNRDQLRDCCRQARQAPCSTVLIRFLHHAAVNGAGITQLIACLSAIRESSKPVAVVGPCENFKTIFQMVGIGRYAALCDTDEQALAALAP